MDRVNLNGVLVYPFTNEEELFSLIENHKSILVSINAEAILNATDETRSIINSNIGYCDGAGAVMALKQKGYNNVCKIAGCELWINIVKRYYKHKSFYLVGSKFEVITKTVDNLRNEYPKINILGFRDGYINSDDEKRALVNDITEKKPDFIFVAMGAPKQDLLIKEMQDQHNAIYMGLGGSFDVYTGFVKRAPKWWVDHNLEFAYRLLKQPKRIGRQMHLLKYIYWLVARKI